VFESPGHLHCVGPDQFEGQYTMWSDWQQWTLGMSVVLWGGVQYGLAVYALRDLVRRPRVRGDNKVLWALAILTLPLVGALLYTSMGPTSFLPRAGRPTVGARGDARPGPMTPSEGTPQPGA